MGRALALTEEEVDVQLQNVRHQFDDRHFDVAAILQAHFEKVRLHVFTQRPLSAARQLLIGALFSGEYALESAAIFNPSIVPHPDQSECSAGRARVL